MSRSYAGSVRVALFLDADALRVPFGDAGLERLGEVAVLLDSLSLFIIFFIDDCNAFAPDLFRTLRLGEVVLLLDSLSLFIIFFIGDCNAFAPARFRTLRLVCFVDAGLVTFVVVFWFWSVSLSL